MEQSSGTPQGDNKWEPSTFLALESKYEENRAAPVCNGASIEHPEASKTLLTSKMPRLAAGDAEGSVRAGKPQCPGCCPQLGPIQVQGSVRGGAGGQETSPPSQGRPRPPSAAGEAVAMATPPPPGQHGRLSPGAGPGVSLGLSRRSGQLTAAGTARAACGAGQAEAGPAPPASHSPFQAVPPPPPSPHPPPECSSHRSLSTAGQTDMLFR